MKAATYFKKNGFIYGVSEKYEFGKWKGYARKFDSLEEAEEWLNTEEYDAFLCLRSFTRDIYRRI